MTILWLIPILVAGLYTLVILLLTVGLAASGKSRKAGFSPARPLSVVVAFRNEEGHLLSLVRDLAGQDYPVGLFEVILVNDHSTDRSPALALEAEKKYSFIRCLDLPPGSRGKKAALAMGIEAAGHDYIVQTDADCKPGRDFLACHARAREEAGAELSAGWVLPERRPGSFLSVFEMLDVMALNAVAEGSFALGMPQMCSGANLGYEKRLHAQTRSMDPGGPVPSGDDMFLMIGARKLGRRMAFISSREAMVRTRGTGSWKDLLLQRMRWGGKSVSYRMPDIQGLALLVGLAALGMVALPFLWLGNPAAWPWLAAAAGMKMLTDLVLLSMAAGYSRQWKAMVSFLPVWLCHQPFLVIAATASLLFKGEWKKRPA